MSEVAEKKNANESVETQAQNESTSSKEKRAATTEERKKAVADMVAKFESLGAEQSKNYFKTLKKSQITKAIMAAYIKKYGNSDEDKVWFETTFRPATKKQKTRATNVVQVVELDGTDSKKKIKYRKPIEDGDTYESYNKKEAIKLFLEHFELKTAETAYADYDEFDNLFD